MESVRRRKLGRNIIKDKRKKLFRETKKCDFQKQKQTNQGCSNSWHKSHPYEANINFVHILRETLLASHCFTLKLLSEIIKVAPALPLPTPELCSLAARCHDASDYLTIFFLEAHFAETREIWYEDEEQFQQQFASRLRGGKGRKLVPCGGYEVCLNKYTEKATERLRYSPSESERKIHRKKLKIFNALKKLDECSSFDDDLMEFD